MWVLTHFAWSHHILSVWFENKRGTTKVCFPFIKSSNTRVKLIVFFQEVLWILSSQDDLKELLLSFQIFRKTFWDFIIKWNLIFFSGEEGTDLERVMGMCGPQDPFSRLSCTYSLQESHFKQKSFKVRSQDPLLRKILKFC